MVEDKWFKASLSRLFDRNRLGKHAREVPKIGKISHPTLFSTRDEHSACIVQV